MHEFSRTLEEVQKPPHQQCELWAFASRMEKQSKEIACLAMARHLSY
jgi:hypothetical protein